MKTFSNHQTMGRKLLLPILSIFLLSPLAAAEDLNDSLAACARHGFTQTATLLVEHGADADMCSSRLTPVLSIAAASGSVGVAEMLLQRGVDPEGKNTLNQSPLHFAAAYGYSGVAEVLLSHGAQPSSLDNHRETPLCWRPRMATPTRPASSLKAGQARTLWTISASIRS